jgi:hypothetical protein
MPALLPAGLCKIDLREPARLHDWFLCRARQPARFELPALPLLDRWEAFEEPFFFAVVDEVGVLGEPRRGAAGRAFCPFAPALPVALERRHRRSISSSSVSREVLDSFQ